MTELGSKDWQNLLKERCRLRDHYRAKFFRDHGVKMRLKEAFDFDPSPAAQISIVKTLQNKIRDGLEGDTDAFDILASLISQTSFSIPVTPVTSVGRPTTETTSRSRMAYYHFSLPIPIRQKD